MTFPQATFRVETLEMEWSILSARGYFKVGTVHSGYLCPILQLSEFIAMIKAAPED